MATENLMSKKNTCWYSSYNKTFNYNEVKG